jgi:hypothetical protein
MWAGVWGGRGGFVGCNEGKESLKLASFLFDLNFELPALRSSLRVFSTFYQIISTLSTKQLKIMRGTL